MKRDLAKGGMRGKVLMHNEEVRLKAMFMNPDSEANKETDPRRKEARYYFDLYDVDGSGSIDVEELQPLLSSLCVPIPSKSNMTQLLAEMDESGDGSIDYEEFIQWYEQTGVKLKSGTKGTALLLKRGMGRAFGGGRAHLDAKARLLAEARTHARADAYGELASVASDAAATGDDVALAAAKRLEADARAQREVQKKKEMEAKAREEEHEILLQEAEGRALEKLKYR